MAFRTAAVACLLACVAPSTAISGEANKYLIISAPAKSQVVYTKLAKDAKSAEKPKTLCSDLEHPQGLAVDQGRSRLYVADPTQAKVIRYDLHASKDGLSVSDSIFVLSGVEARWVAVDTVGNLFVSDESQNQILKVPSNKVLQGGAVPKVVYSGKATPQVSAPGGIAVDNFFVYWSNKEMGTQVGSLVKGSEVPSAVNAQSGVQVLAQNVVKTYGVCLDLDNVYYTADDTHLYGTKKNKGASAVEVSNKLEKPRGCAWDGEGTVFVADRQLNKVFSFAGNMKDLGGTSLSSVVSFDDAFGVAVFSGARGQWTRGLGISLVLAAALVAAGGW